MSAIAGIFNLDGRPVDRELLTRMTDVVAYRGPDRGGVWSEGPVGLGHRMLCTTPESLRETQPLRDEQAQLCLVLDGRVDNRDELRRALLARGARLRDDTDAELVLRAYEVWGEDCPKEIIGDFAFAVWDGRKRQLFCARDFLGIKPFYYYLDGNTFHFGSELHQILEDETIRREPNEGMVGEYLANAITNLEETLFQGIMRLSPAHALIVRVGYLRKQRYWNPDFSKSIQYQTDEEYAEHFLAIFKEAIRCRLRSIGAVGIALSGGLDSSSIACVAQSMCQESGPVNPELMALSEIFPGLPCDESQYIQDVVSLWDLKSEIVQREDVDASLYSKQARRYYDFPGYPNSGMAEPISFLAQKKGLRVLLDGVGGDQWFTGSKFYYADLMSQLQITAFIRQIRCDIRYRGFFDTLSQVLWYGINPLIPQPVRAIAKWVLRKKEPVPTWINIGFADKARITQRINRRPVQASGSSFAQKELWQFTVDGFGVHSYEIEDRAASSFGFERRHPFQDRRLVEFALALPEDQRCRQGWTKYILRIAMEDYLPETVRLRWDKAEFSTLFLRLLEGDAVAKLFDTLEIASTRWVDGRLVRNMYRQMLQRYHQGDEDYGQCMWSLWMLVGIELWHNQTFLERNILSSIQAPANESDHGKALVSL